MKKLFYIVLVVVLLFAIVQVIKNKQAETSAPAVDVVDTVSVGEDAIGDLVIQEDVIAVDENTGDAVAEEEVDVIDVVEENPDETAGDDETIIQE